MIKGFDTLINGIYGGEYRLVAVEANRLYTFRTCGNNAFDTQLTLYNDADGTPFRLDDDFYVECNLKFPGKLLLPEQ